MAKVSILAQKDKKIFEVDCGIDFEILKRAKEKAPVIRFDYYKSGKKFTESRCSELSKCLNYVINAYECYLSDFNEAQQKAADRADRAVEIEGWDLLNKAWKASNPNDSPSSDFITNMLEEHCKQNVEVPVPEKIILNKGDCALEVRDLFSYSPECEEDVMYNDKEKRGELQALYDGIKNAIKIYSIEETTEYDESFPGVREPEKYICDLPDLKPFTDIMKAQEIVIGQEIKNLLKEEPVLSIDSAKFNQL